MAVVKHRLNFRMHYKKHTNEHELAFPKCGSVHIYLTCAKGFNDLRKIEVKGWQKFF